MSQSELLAQLAETLTRLGIDHMITGSLASSLYGEPRATHGIDVVAAPSSWVAGFTAGW